MNRQFRKIIYVTYARLPTQKAHGLATVKLTEALSVLGWKIDVLAPRLWKSSREDVFTYYHLKRIFKIEKIFCLDLFSLGLLPRLTFLIRAFSFCLSALVYVFFKHRENLEEIIFLSHDSLPLYFLSFITKNIFYDIHHFPSRNFFYKKVIKKAMGFAVQTKWKAKALREKFGVEPEKIVYWPNGTEVEKFKISISQEAAREKLDLARGLKIVLYTGQLFGWKGIDTLIKSVNLIKQNAHIFIVGGGEKDVQIIKKEIPEADNERIKFIPFQPHELIPFWLKAADVLVLPNTGRQKVSLYYTSPMKMFEYMASGRPVVASAIPSLLEILNKRNALLAEADNPLSFAQKINEALDYPSRADLLAKQAQIDVQKYTWEERAKRISQYLIKKL